MKRVLFLVVAILAVALTSASAQHISNVRSSIGRTAANGGVVTITEDEGVKTAIAKVEAKTYLGILETSENNFKYGEKR